MGTCGDALINSTQIPYSFAGETWQRQLTSEYKPRLVASLVRYIVLYDFNSLELDCKSSGIAHLCLSLEDRLASDIAYRIRILYLVVYLDKMFIHLLILR